MRLSKWSLGLAQLPEEERMATVMLKALLRCCIDINPVPIPVFSEYLSLVHCICNRTNSDLI